MVKDFNNYQIKNKHSLPAISTLLIALVVLLSAIPREIVIYSFNDQYTRQYGRSISIPYAIICTFLLLFIKRGKLKINKYAKKSPFLFYLVYGVFSVAFIIFNKAELPFYSVAAFKYVLYIISFLILSSSVSLKNYLKGLDLGFKIALMLQTLIGWLYEFAGITVPYIGKYSVSYRNGLSRMEGTFTHPGDFSLYAGILFIYFFYKFLYKKGVVSLVYSAVAYIDIFLSGARTMLLTISVLVAIILFFRYRQLLLVKILLAIGISGGLYWFFNSDIYIDMFLEHDFSEMFVARFTHWIVGFNIMFSSIESFLFGVGLNNHVRYIDENYGMFALVVSSAGDALESEFVRGMPIHNSFIIVGCELGIVGTLSYLSYYIFYICEIGKVFHKDSRYRRICAFIISSIVIIMIYSIQGWAMMKTFAWEIVIVIFALSSQILKDYKNSNLCVGIKN
ncbi:O-antigen ligase family protein [Butyrivibrio fibrisolvens]|uniref:O-antigen ligase family protein n=1 Tax=Butyrivibrio fibrisolvens TaxID=831 RepID=UPI0003B67F9A|nr:O-antigen ligase family protein [Butyrivibrio fibrisolvens]